MGIMSIIILPAIILIAIGLIFIRKYRNDSEKPSRSWKFSERSSGIYNDLSLPRHDVSLKNIDRAVSPSSESSTGTSSFGTKRRLYDKVYRTHEPLPNRPDIEFEDKDWDLKESISPDDASDSATNSIKKTESPSKESDV